MLNRFNLVSAALLLVAGVGGFTLWPKSGPATPLGAAVGSVHLSALDIQLRQRVVFPSKPMTHTDPRYLSAVQSSVTLALAARAHRMPGSGFCWRLSSHA